MPNKKKRTARKKSARKAAKRNFKTIKAASKSLTRKKKFSPKKKRVTSTGVVAETVPVSYVPPEARAQAGAGDLQELSNRATANSERVDELVEEGNASEADAVQGVEDARDADQGEVRTHEVPDDDVPQEYLDKDQ